MCTCTRWSRADVIAATCARVHCSPSTAGESGYTCMHACICARHMPQCVCVCHRRQCVYVCHRHAPSAHVYTAHACMCPVRTSAHMQTSACAEGVRLYACTRACTCICACMHYTRKYAHARVCMCVRACVRAHVPDGHMHMHIDVGVSGDACRETSVCMRTHVHMHVDVGVSGDACRETHLGCVHVYAYAYACRRGRGGRRTSVVAAKRALVIPAHSPISDGFGIPGLGLGLGLGWG